MLPYFPQLRKLVASHGAALIISYLELYYPAPQDSWSQPVSVDLLRLLREMAVREAREWLRYFSYIGTIFAGEAQRRAAVVAGREFTRPDRRWGIGAIKCYSLTRAGLNMYSLRRNTTQLTAVLHAAGAAQLLAQPALWQTQAQSGEVSPRPAPLLDRDYFSSAPIDDLILRRPEVVAAEVARSLNKISGLGDGRRRVGIKRAAYVRKPWSEERRAKSRAMWAKLRAEKSVTVEDRGSGNSPAPDSDW